ncbi:MAG: hypothetical protein PHC61_14765 [Chitinivibrionales bacterium]|nr:hypothetical protein [Chitinivibrionales bacterium]
MTANGFTSSDVKFEEKTLMNKADEAMYQSKREGRARITVHD